MAVKLPLRKKAYYLRLPVQFTSAATSSSWRPLASQQYSEHGTYAVPCIAPWTPAAETETATS